MGPRQGCHQPPQTQVAAEHWEVALADPLALSRHDPHPDGDRWDTLCHAGTVLLFVVHTWPDDDTPGRIISARKATRQERKAYEDG